VPAIHGYHPGRLRVTPPGQLRVLRLARGGNLVIDLNDFDEAHPGGWEWGPAPVGGQHLGRRAARTGASEGAVRRVGAVVCRLLPPGACAGWADQPLFSRSFVRLDVDRLAAETAGSAGQAGGWRARPRRARNRPSGPAPLPRFTREVDGVRKIVEEPPLITRPAGSGRRRLLAGRRSTSTCKPFPRIGGRVLRAANTLVDVAPQGWSGGGQVSVWALTWRCWRVPRRRMWCSCSSSKAPPVGVCWRAYVHGESAWACTPGPSRGWWSTSRRCRRLSDPLLGWTTMERAAVLRAASFRKYEGHHPRWTRWTRPH